MGTKFIDEYFKKLNYNPTLIGDAMFSELRAMDFKRASNIVIYTNERSEGNYSHDREFYNALYGNLDFALIMGLAFDYGLYKKSFEYFEEHKNDFGKEILVVGCGCGIEACFLGMLMPESHIVGIDVLTNAVKASKCMAERLNLTNVEFQEIDFKKMKNRQYSDIVSLRSIHEMCESEMKDIDMLPITNLRNICAYGQKRDFRTALQFEKVLMNGGHLYLFERNVARVFSFIFSLKKHIKLSELSFFTVNELGKDESLFLKAVFEKKEFVPESFEETLNKITGSFVKTSKKDIRYLEGMEVHCYLEAFRLRLVYGKYGFYGDYGYANVKRAIYKNDSENIYYYLWHDSYGFSFMRIDEADLKDKIGDVDVITGDGYQSMLVSDYQDYLNKKFKFENSWFKEIQ